LAVPGCGGDGEPLGDGDTLGEALGEALAEALGDWLSDALGELAAVSVTVTSSKWALA
jgi:hypothetical protein